MRDPEPDDGLWFVLGECEREIYRDAPGLAEKFDRWECPPAVATAPVEWHDTRTVLPQP